VIWPGTSSVRYNSHSVVLEEGRLLGEYLDQRSRMRQIGQQSVILMTLLQGPSFQTLARRWLLCLVGGTPLCHRKAQAARMSANDRCHQRKALQCPVMHDPSHYMKVSETRTPSNLTGWRETSPPIFEKRRSQQCTPPACRSQEHSTRKTQHMSV